MLEPQVDESRLWLGPQKKLGMGRLVGPVACFGFSMYPFDGWTLESRAATSKASPTT